MLRLKALIEKLASGNVEYISLTDIARYKNSDTPNDVVKKCQNGKQILTWNG